MVSQATYGPTRMHRIKIGYCNKKQLSYQCYTPWQQQVTEFLKLRRLMLHGQNEAAMQQRRIKGNVHAMQLVEVLIFCFYAGS